MSQSDADSLAAAALLSSGPGRSRALALITRATSAAPDRPDLAWLEAQVCAAVASCNPEPVERRLRALDPSNGAGWMGELTRADAAKDVERRDRALSRIAQSTRVEIYWTTLIARLSEAAARTRKLSLSEVETLIIGSLAAQAIPAYSAASNACKGDRLQQPEVVQVCRGVAKAFSAGDTYITEMIGIAVTKRVWPESSSEWSAANEARRVYEYRSQRFEKLADDPQDIGAAKRYLALCAQNRREQDVFRAALVAAGQNPDPPAAEGASPR
jgi:hypothetical protein